MAGMRDRVIHGYFSVNLRIVWETVKLRIPQALPAVRRCFEVLEAEEDS